MANRIIEGFWDCSYCGHKAIGGLTKECPSCGHPQGEGIKFYMKEDDKRYLDDEKAKEYGKGADWQCDFCGSYNRYNIINCENCGSSKNDSKKDYFGNNINGTESSEEDEEDEKDNNISQKRTITELFSKFNFKALGKPLAIGLGVISLITLLIFIFMPRDYEARVISNSWNRSISIESYEWVDDNSWYSAPNNARNISCKKEIHHYDEVLDHYETVQVQKSRQVFDHTEYEEHVSYIDNGDGTFTEHTYTIPHDVYRTEYYYEDEEKPVYISVPVYEKRYYYEIQKWIFNRTEKSSGIDEYEFYWPEYELKDNERVSSKDEKYTLKFVSLKDDKEYNATVPEEYINQFKIGQDVTITVQVGFVTKINGDSI